jgi:membrane-associated phospholipid phosphatase
MIGTDLRESAGDAWTVWASPIHARGSDWLGAAGTLVAAAALSRFDDNIDRWAVRHQDDGALHVLQPIRTGGVAFSGRTITPVALGTLAVGLITKNQGLQEGLFGCATAYASSSIVRTYVIYPLVARTRPDPRSSNGEAAPAVQGDQYHFAFPGSHDWGQHSFPGGHLANVTACTAFLTRRYSWKYVDPVLWTAVGAVAVARTLDRGHWASDELVGAAFGYAVGKVVALRSLKRDARSTHADSTVVTQRAAQLFIEPDEIGMRAGWKIAF